LELERLEDRTAPAAFTVTNATDNPNDVTGPVGANSFRGIINQADLAGGGTINFAANVNTIHLAAPLGEITAPVILNGTGVTILCPDSGSTSNGRPANGLNFTAAGNKVTGLTVVGLGASQNGLVFSGDGNTVTGVTAYGFGSMQMSFSGNGNQITNN
jgi:hypothetical protein